MQKNNISLKSKLVLVRTFFIAFLAPKLVAAASLTSVKVQ